MCGDRQMTDCNKCEICKRTSVRSNPFGSENPVIYIIGESLNPEEFDTGQMFTGTAAKNFIELLDSYGLNTNNTRFNNLVLCFPCDENNNFRKIEKDEIRNCFSNLSEDIQNHMPKLIITLGATSSSVLIDGFDNNDPEFKNITSCHGQIYQYKYDSDLPFGIPVMPMYHPAYLLRRSNDAKLLMDVKNDIQKALEYVSGNNVISDINTTNFATSYDDNTVQCLSYSDFDNFCKEEIDNAETISYDIESNAEEKTSERFEIVGFSLASRSNKGCYVVIESLDYHMSSRDKSLVMARLRKILLNKTKITYNSMYEMPSTFNKLGIEIDDKIEDLFVIVKLLMGNAGKYEGNGGLKIQAMMNLNTKDWSEDLDYYFKYLTEFKNSKDKMTNLLSKYYDSSDELNEVMNMVEECYNNPDTFKNGVISYGKVPFRLISKYGGTDASILFDLKQFYESEMNRYNKELGIDLYKGYRYWMNHHIAGYTLERNGAYWNEGRALEVEDWCNTGMRDALKELVMSPLSASYIKKKLHNDFLIYAKDNLLDKILSGTGAVPRRNYKTSVRIYVDKNNASKEFLERLEGMSLYPDEKSSVVKLELGHIDTLMRDSFGDSKYDLLFNSWYRRYMYDVRNNPDITHDQMKCLINPRAVLADFKEFVSDILITDEIRYAKFYDNLIIYIESPKFESDCDMSGNGPFANVDVGINTDDFKFLKFIQKLNSDADMKGSDKLRLMLKYLDKVSKFTSYPLKHMLNNALMKYRLDKLDDPTIIGLYKLYEMIGLNIEDKSSWSEEFKWLYNYRIYKKYAKILSTYINGKVGRNNVWYVDANSFESGDKITRRQIKYWETKDDSFDKSLLINKVPIYQSSFMVDFADTGRWTSGFHTLPAGDTIKKIYTSRFKGGIIAMPDCSQAEVRMLAAVSGDENLLRAFQQDGMDIHKYVASMIWHNSDMSKVTKTERKIAKGAVFGILYGESEKSFANSFCHGNIDEAKEIFDYFYNAFPKIKAYVDDAHDMFTRTGKISLRMMGRFINLEPQVALNGGDKDRVLRQSQNYIIQGQTCDLAGMILYNICKYVKDNHMKSKPFCFIHDSIEIDIHPDETFKMLDMLKPIFNSYPWDNFGVPMASDIVFSSNMGSEIEVVDMIHDDDYNDVTITIEGVKDDIDEVEDLWKSVYKLVDKVEEEHTGESYIPYSGLFQPKVTMSKLIGIKREEVKRVYHVIRR